MSRLPDKENKTRVWEVDALRGIMILCVLATHLYYCVDAFCINGYYNIDSYQWVEATDPLHFWFDWGEDGVIYRAFLNPTLISLWVRAGVDGFFVISGIACMFSRDHIKRGVKTLAGGLFIAAFTFGLWKWTGDPTRFIRWGVLMCYASCQLIYAFFLENKSNKTLLLIAAPVFIIGYFLHFHHVESSFALLYPFGIYETGGVGSDYWPILPMLGWFLLGVVLGRKYYPEKKTLLPYALLDRLTKPLQWFGRHSGVIYVGHIVIYTVLFCGIGYLFKLL